MTLPEVELEPLAEHHLDAIRRIQQAAPQSAGWPVEAYRSYRAWVAIAAGAVAGFIAIRDTAPDEREILDLAVDPAMRRRRVGTILLARATNGFEGKVFLEVRAGNAAAIAFYRKHGFQPAGIRRNYYFDTGEDAVVMALRSC